MVLNDIEVSAFPRLELSEDGSEARLVIQQDNGLTLRLRLRRELLEDLAIKTGQIAFEAQKRTEAKGGHYQSHALPIGECHVVHAVGTGTVILSLAGNPGPLQRYAMSHDLAQKVSDGLRKAGRAAKKQTQQPRH